jgi:hypothetical protein
MFAMELISIDYDVLLSYIKQCYWLKKLYGKNYYEEFYIQPSRDVN